MLHVGGMTASALAGDNGSQKITVQNFLRLAEPPLACRQTVLNTALAISATGVVPTGSSFAASMTYEAEMQPWDNPGTGFIFAAAWPTCLGIHLPCRC